MSNQQVSFIQTRLKALCKNFENNQALLLTNPNDIFYFSNFNFLVPEEREAFLIITKKTTYLMHASFSPYQKQSGITGIKGCSLDKIKDQLQDIYNQEKITELIIDETSLFVDEYKALKQLSFLKLTGLARQIIWKQRLIKDKNELSHMRKAAQISSQVMKTVLTELEVNMTEKEVADHIEEKMKQAGSQQPAFPTIVAFGSNAALPHHQPTDTKLVAETAILLDFGATVNNYRSDMTRTIWFGKKPSSEFKKVELVVKQAYQAVLDRLSGDQPVLAKNLDQAARGVITEAGYGERFTHTTGHGVGIDIHENLSLNWKNKQKILPNMVITVEPGIYLENMFGYRYENTILITGNKIEELTL